MNAFYSADGLLYILWTLASVILFLAVALAKVRSRTGVDGARWQTEVAEPSPLLAPVLLTVLILAFGLRPLLPIYTDMGTYAREFEFASAGISIFRFNDPVFQSLLLFLSNFHSVTLFFVVIAAIYVGTKSFALHHWLGSRWVLLLPAIITTFHFYGYGVNTVRQGIAASVFLLAVVSRRPGWSIALCVLSIGLHLSLLMGVLAMIAVRFHRSTRTWLVVWALAALVGILTPVGTFSVVGTWFERGSAYWVTGGVDATYEARLRLDFIGYSLIGVGAAFYWRRVEHVEDKRYTDLTNIFLLSNAVWVLVHKIPFTDRVAYPSWMLNDIVVLAPLLLDPRRFRFWPFFGLAIANVLLTVAVA